MNWMTFARAGKVIALLAFLMPWLVVSCDGSTVASASGIDLALGSVDTTHVQAAEYARVHLWALIVLALTIGALVISFIVRPPERAGKLMAMTLSAALFFAVLGMAMTISGARADLVERGQTLTADSLRFDAKAGYWLTLMALMGAALASWMIYRERPFPSGAATTAGTTDATPAPSPVHPSPTAAAAPIITPPPTEAVTSPVVAGANGSDEAYWDSLSDKTDPAALEEYIYRFPDGRFVGLARERLSRRPPT